MKYFFTIAYWFNLRPESLTVQGLRNFFVFIIILAIFTSIFAILKSRYKRGLFSRIWKKLYFFNLANLVIGIFLLFFVYESIPFLSARFWLLAWWLSMIVWIFFIIKELMKIPKIREELEKEKEFKKYIP